MCGALVLGGVAAELTLTLRPPPAQERRLKDNFQERYTERHLAALLARRAPRLDEGLRDRLSEAIWAESGKAGYDPLFVLALVGVESGFRVRAESERGARGLLQLTPTTFAWMSAREPDAGGAELGTGEDPIVDVRLAVRYFRWLEKKFRTRDAALWAYNAGPAFVTRALKKDEVPPRLLQYSRLVRREHERLVQLAEGLPPAAPRKPTVPPPEVLLAEGDNARPRRVAAQ